MTKKKTPTVKEAPAPATRQIFERLAQLAKANKDRFAKLNKSTKIILALLLFSTLLFTHAHHGIMTAALYIFANDGAISGRQSGSVKTRNGIERKFTVPRLVRNAYTTGARAALSLYSSLWNTLTFSERASWNNVTNVFKSNRFGVSFPLKGKQLFVERNINLTIVGISPILSYIPSAGVDGSIQDNGTATTVAGALTVLTAVFSPSPTDTSVETKVFATAPMSAGTSRPSSSAYRLITVLTAGTTSPANILGAYSAKFGTSCQPGQTIGVRFSSVNNTTGEGGVINDVINVAT